MKRDTKKSEVEDEDWRTVAQEVEEGHPQDDIIVPATITTKSMPHEEEGVNYSMIVFSNFNNC